MRTRLRRIFVGLIAFAAVFAIAPRAFAGMISFTSPNNATFVAGTGGTFTVTTTGFTTGSHPKLGVTGSLPAGVSFADNTNGTGTLTVTAAADAGMSNWTFTAARDPAVPTDSDATPQPFTLTLTNPTPTCIASKTASGAATTNFARRDRLFVRGILPGATVTGTTGEQYNVLFNGDIIGSDRVDTDRFRSYITAVSIPSDAPLGANLITVKTATSGITARCPVNIVTAAQATATPRPTASPTAAPLPTALPLSALRTATPAFATTSGVALPKTGFPVWAYIAFGVTLIEIGAGLLLFADSRRRVPVLIPHVRRAANAIRIRWG